MLEFSLRAVARELAMRAVHTVVAVVADCDDTLAPDTTEQLLKHFDVDAKAFYEQDAKRLINAGFDPAVAYLSEILRLARKKNGPLKDLTERKIRTIGAKLRFFPGVPECFRRLQKEIEQTYKESGVRVETYVISGGIADLIKASPLGKVAKQVWGCNFGYDGKGKVSCIKNVVSFTEKTRYLFNIQKGLAGSEFDNRPYEVNTPMESDERRIPFKNMVYLGDGPSDIPCMSIIQDKGQGYGCVIGILQKRRPYETWKLGFGRRATLTVPPDFRKGKWGYNQLREAIVQIANRIKSEQKITSGHTPTY